MGVKTSVPIQAEHGGQKFNLIQASFYKGTEETDDPAYRYNMIKWMMNCGIENMKRTPYAMLQTTSLWTHTRSYYKNLAPVLALDASADVYT